MLGRSALSILPLSGLTDAQITQVETRTLRFASRSFVTRQTDSPAHEYIDGRIARGLRLERHLTTAEEGQFGSLIETRRDDIYLNNNDGELDYLVDEYAADGREIRLLIGATEIVNGREIVQPYANFATVYTTVAGPWTFERNTVKLRIESLVNRLQNNLQQQTYAGTGGQQGTADMAGRTLPTAFGRCLNIPAQLVDPTILTYQLHGGSIDSITAVYDAGATGLTFDANYTTYAALETASVPAGTYATSVETGFIKLGSIPIGDVTADIRGSNASDGIVGYTDQHAPVIRKILLIYGGFASANLDLTSFTIYDAIQPESMGIFFPTGDQSTVQDAIELIAFSGGAFVGQDRTGLFRMQRLDAPSQLVHWFFDDREIIDIERLDLPYGVPWRAWGVAYQRNWTVQTDADLATSVSQSRRQFLETETRYAYAQNSAVVSRHASSSGAPLRPALFLDSSAAAAEAERLSTLYGVKRALYSVVVKTALFSVEVGHTVRLMDDRWDLAGGKNFVVVGIEDDADRIETRLLVFG